MIQSSHWSAQGEIMRGRRGSESSIENIFRKYLAIEIFIPKEIRTEELAEIKQDKVFQAPSV